VTTKAQLLKLRFLRRHGVALVPPVITSASTGFVAENAPLAFTLSANEAVTWLLAGGPDVGLFEISGSTLRWIGNGTRDFEAVDAGDNVFVVTVQATSVATSLTAQASIAITVTDVVEVGVPDLIPSAQWGATGVVGSGWTVANPQPTASPDRLLTDPPKARIRPLFVPRQTIDGDMIIGFDASAEGGLQRVRVHMEGNYVDVTTETRVDYVDVNGVADWFFGHCVRLKHAEWLALNASGEASIYAEAVPVNPAIQTRIIGPLNMRARSTAKLYDVVLDWTPSLPDSPAVLGADGVWRGRYNTFEKALEFCHGSATRHHCKITAKETLNYNMDVVVSPSRPAGVQSWIVLTHDPGVEAQVHGNGLDFILLNTTMICFRGSGIVYQPDLGNINVGAAVYIWGDGMTIENASPEGMYNNTLAPSPTYFLGSAAVFVYWTDVMTTAGLHYGQLARGCYIVDNAGDSYDHNKCVHNCDAVRNNHNPPRTNAGNESLSVSHPAGTATLECSGDPRITTRTITIKNAGSTIASFALSGTVGALGHTFTDVANWINTTAAIQALGITATVLPMGLKKRATFISSGEAGTSNNQDLSPTVTLPATRLKATGTVFSAIIDGHGDGVQYTVATYENICIRFLRITDTIAAQSFFIESQVFKDFAIRDCLFWSQGGGAGIDSDWGGDHSHTTVEDCTFANILVEWVIGTSAGGFPNTIFSCDTFCAWRRNYIHQAVWLTPGSYVPDPNVVIDANYFYAGTLPARATSSPPVTSPALDTLFNDPSGARDYSPVLNGPLKFGAGANDYYGCFLPNGSLRALAA